MEKKEERNEEIRPEEGEIYILDVKAETSEIKVTGSVFLPAELQCRSDAISGLLGASSFSTLPASELCSRNLVAVTVIDDNGKPRLCRAVITDTSEVPKGFLRVLLVDECCPDIQVRLSHLYYCPKHVSASKYPPSCQQFVLADVMPIEDRLLEAEKWLQCMLLNKTVEAVFERHPDGTSYICPLDHQKLPLVFSMLVAGLAKMSTKPLISVGALTGNSNVKLETKAESPAPSSQRVTYSQWKMPLGVRETADVTTVEKGPWKFCLQFKRQKEQIPSLREKLKILVLTGKLSKGGFNTGDAVVCPNKIHGGHSRGLITNKLPDNMCSVYYVDEGSKALLSEKELWLLPEGMAKIPLLVHRCCLDGLAPSEDKDISDKFEALVKEQNLLASLVKIGKDVPTTVNLFSNGKNSVLDLLTCSYKQEILLDNFLVSISYISEEQAILYLVLCENGEMLDKLHLSVQEAAKVAGPLEFPEKHQSCLALFPDDGFWYRATVLNAADLVHVRYVDYGNESSLPRDSLRVIHATLVQSAPSQALPCLLSEVDQEPLSLVDVNEVTDESMFKVQIIGRKEMAGLGSVAVVELVTKSTGVSLNQLLRDKKQRAEKEINNNTNKHCFSLGAVISRMQQQHASLAQPPRQLESQPQQELLLQAQQSQLQQRFSQYQRHYHQPYHHERERRFYQGRFHQQQQQQYPLDIQSTKYKLQRQQQQFYTPRHQQGTQYQHRSESHHIPYNSNQVDIKAELHSPKDIPLGRQRDRLVPGTPKTTAAQAQNFEQLERVRPAKGSLKFCRLTWEAGLSCFYLVLEESEEFIKACTKKMSESCNQSKMESIKSGMLVAIKDKDTWQRAQVTQVQGTMFKVIMIDVGKERCLQLYELKSLPETLSKVPAQAIRCCLQESSTKSLDLKPHSQLASMMNTRLVAHFIGCEDHVWKVNLYIKAELEPDHGQAKQLSTMRQQQSGSLDAACSRGTVCVKAVIDPQHPYSSRDIIAGQKLLENPTSQDKDLGITDILSSPVPHGVHDEQLKSFSPNDISVMETRGPFTSTTRLDLASNSVSPSAIPLEETASSDDSRSTVRHNVSAVEHEDFELSGAKVGVGAPVNMPNNLMTEVATAKPTVKTRMDGAASAVQYVASHSADMVISAALATHAHSHKKLEGFAKEDSAASESLLWDSRIGGLNGNDKCDKNPNSYGAEKVAAAVKESLLWNSKYGELNSNDKLEDGNTEKTANEESFWDSRHVGLGKDFNGNNKRRDKSASPCEGNTGSATEQSLLWDSRYGGLNSNNKPESEIVCQKIPCAETTANESLLWDSRRGGLHADKDGHDEKGSMDSSVPCNETTGNESVVLLWDSRCGGLETGDGKTVSAKCDTKDDNVDLKSKIAKVQDNKLEKDCLPSLSPKILQLELPLQAKINVSIVFVSGLSIWVQLDEHLGSLNEMMEYLHTQMETLKAEHLSAPQVGEQCISKYHLDGGWYRASVLEVEKNPEKVKVHYFDYGNTEFVEKHDLYALPQQFCDLPCQALHCCLPQELEGWQEPYQEQLEACVGKSAVISVKEGPKEHTWTLLSLEVEGTDLVDQIRQEVPVPAEEEVESEELQVTETETEKALQIHYPPQTVLSSGIRVYVSYLAGGAEVWLQKAEDLSVAENMAAQIARAQTTTLESERVIEDMPCLAQSAADNVWYRAKIVSLNEPDQVKIHFIDYGNSEIMSMNNIREVPDELLLVGPLAHSCVLTGKGEPHEIDLKALEEKFLEQELVVCVFGSEDGKTLVSLLLDDDVVVEDSVGEPATAKDDTKQRLVPDSTDTPPEMSTSVAAPSACRQDTEEVVDQNLNGEIKSRKWYVPAAKGEDVEKSDFLLTSSLPAETPAEHTSPTSQQEMSKGNVSPLTGVFMNFRKNKDTISGISSSEMENHTPTSKGSAVFVEESRPGASPPPHSSNRNGAGGQQVNNPNFTNGLTSFLPSVPGRVTHSTISSPCKTELKNIPKTETKELLTTLLKDCSDMDESSIVDHVKSKHEQKEMKGDDSVKDASPEQKGPQGTQTVHGRRFLDCIEEVEECSDDGFTEMQINPYSAYLVHIEESPFSLWIQKEEDNDLAEYIETWYKEHNQERVDTIKVGDICVTVLGDSAQRAYVQCIEDANITVLLIDQGRHAVISKQDLFKLPSSLTDIHPLAMQIYLPVKVAPGRESGAVIAVAEVAHQLKCVCLDLDNRYTLIWCPGVGDLGDFLVDNKLATPMHWNVGWKYRYITSVKRRLEEEAFLLTSDARQEDSFYQTADTDLAARLEQSLKTLNANSA